MRVPGSHNTNSNDAVFRVFGGCSKGCGRVTGKIARALRGLSVRADRTKVSGLVSETVPYAGLELQGFRGQLGGG